MNKGTVSNSLVHGLKFKCGRSLAGVTGISLALIKEQRDGSWEDPNACVGAELQGSHFLNMPGTLPTFLGILNSTTWGSFQLRMPLTIASLIKFSWQVTDVGEHHPALVSKHWQHTWVFTEWRNGDAGGWRKVIGVTLSARNFSFNLSCFETLLLLLSILYRRTRGEAVSWNILYWVVQNNKALSESSKRTKTWCFSGKKIITAA